MFFLCAIPCPVPMPLRPLFTMLHDSSLSSLKILRKLPLTLRMWGPQGTSSVPNLLTCCPEVSHRPVLCNSAQARLRRLKQPPPQQTVAFFFLTVAPRILSYRHWQVCFSWSPSPWLACVLAMFSLHVCVPVLSLNVQISSPLEDLSQIRTHTNSCTPTTLRGSSLRIQSLSRYWVLRLQHTRGAQLHPHAASANCPVYLPAVFRAA